MSDQQPLDSPESGPTSESKTDSSQDKPKSGPTPGASSRGRSRKDPADGGAPRTDDASSGGGRQGQQPATDSSSAGQPTSDAGSSGEGGSGSPPDTKGRRGEGQGAKGEGGSDGGDGASSEETRSQDSGGDSNRRRGRRGRGRRRRGRSKRREPQDEDLSEDDENREPGQLLGVLEVLSSGSGFIRRPEAGYVPSKNDIYVGSRIIHRFGLRTGDELTGAVGRKPRNGKSPPLRYLDLVNGEAPDEARKRPEFNRLSAMHPREQLRLECGRTIGGQPDMTNRVIDLFCPFGKGQRAMIVAPAKAGKTTILQAVAEGITKNHPECELMILLVDERPEEVTEMEMCGYGEIIASTFDLSADRHCQVAEMTLERARRRVEAGKDVVIILDSITRLARAYNTIEEGSGRTLSGGLDASSLEKPKRFLGSARLIKAEQGGGSLTIIATALVDTGSRMDQVIFEEFKGTGNSELTLSRDLADKRIYPAIDLAASATRKEELLLPDDALTMSRAMRRQLSDVSPADGMDELLRVMRQTTTNQELIDRAMQKL